MGTIRALYNKCKALDIKKAAEEAVIKSGSALIDYNKRQLYDKSELASGERLAPYNSILYAIDKERMNPAPGFMNPDLYLTGAFQKGFNLTVKDYSFEVDSSDSKSDKLKKQYGDNIFGLSPTSKEEYIPNEFFQALKNIIEDKTGLTFS